MRVEFEVCRNFPAEEALKYSLQFFPGFVPTLISDADSTHDKDRLLGVIKVLTDVPGFVRVEKVHLTPAC